MHNEFTALIEPDGEWFAACYAEVPEANGRGREPEEAKQHSAAAIALVLEDRRDDVFAQLHEGVLRQVVTVDA